MNCSHCQKELPENYAASFCPHCGGAVQQPDPVTPDTPPLVPTKINWWIFFGVLLAPPLLTLITAFLDKERSNQELSPFIAFFGGAAAGIACGIMLALRIGKNVAARVALAIVFSIVLAVLCIMLSLGGCMAGGYYFQMR